MKKLSESRKILINTLLQMGYEKIGYWFKYEDFMIKLNKRTITLKSQKGTQLTYANPDKICIEDLEKIIETSMI